MRHLYARAKEPGGSYVIDKAKVFERRRCGHLPEDYPDPLSTRECLMSVIDGKNSGTNKHRYVVASQDANVRSALRRVKGVPLIYINRSVMIMEPMAEQSADMRDRDEKVKFRDGIKRMGRELKRKREDDVDDALTEGQEVAQSHDAPTPIEGQQQQPKKKKKRYGVKGPNPLSVMKAKKTTQTMASSKNSRKQTETL